MKIIDRYIVSEMMAPFILGVLGFIMIMTVDLIFTFTDLIINRGVPIVAVLRLIVFKLPAIMVLTFPVATLFATTMTLGRLGKDYEIVALRTSGISLFRISLPIILTAGVISMISFVGNEKIVPYANHVSENIIRQVILRQPLPDIRENVFFKDASNRYFYIGRVHPKTNAMDNIMVYEMTGGNIPQVIIAKNAVWKDRMWTLQNGIIHKFDDTGHLSYETTFDSMKIFISENMLSFSQQKTTEEMSSNELKGLMTLLKKGGVNTQALSVDYQMKFAVPVVSLIFALIGIPLSLPAIRSGKTWGIVIVVCMIFTYYVFASIFRSLGRGGIINPALAAWGPPLLTFIIGTFLIIKEGKYK